MYVGRPLTVYYPSPPSQEVARALQDRVGNTATVAWEGNPPTEATMLIEGRPSLDLLEQLPDLRHVVIPFAGVPETTLEVLSQFPDVSLHNLHHNAPETAELAMSLLLAAAKQVVPHDRKMRALDWSPRYMPTQTVVLDGKTLLVLGYGQIGRRVAVAARGLGMNVVAVRATAGDVSDDGIAEVHPVDHLHSVLLRANAMVIAVPMTSRTAGLLGRDELALLPPHAILVNVARAKIVDEEALFNALRDGALHSAGLDVWYAYPQESSGPGGQSVPTYYDMPASALNTAPSRFPFQELENVVMSPHRGGVSMDTEGRRVEHLAAIVLAAASGEALPNRVSLSSGY